MTLQIKVELDGVHDVAVDDETCRTITTLVRWSCREEADMVPFPDDDHRYLWFNIERRASLYKARVSTGKLSGSVRDTNSL